MKAIVNGNDLSLAVLKVSKAISTRTTNPILSGIKLSVKNDVLTLTATDTELLIEKKIKCETFLEGATVVIGKLFTDFVNKLSGEEQIELSLQENNKLKIIYNNSDFYIQTMNVEEFPIINKDMNENYFTISKNDFKEVINMTAFSCSMDDSRPILKGCLLEIEDGNITSVALDGFRLALAKRKIKSASNNLKAIVHNRALNEIVRLLDDGEEDIEVKIENNYLMLEIRNTILITRLLEGEYINYKQIIPNDFLTTIEVEKTKFLSSLERASILAKDSKNIVKFDVRDNSIIINANSENGNINEIINANISGKDIVIAFNVKYVTDILKVVNEENVLLYCNSSISPCVIKNNEKEDYLYLILPVRVNS